MRSLRNRWRHAKRAVIRPTSKPSKPPHCSPCHLNVLLSTTRSMRPIKLHHKSKVRLDSLKPESLRLKMLNIIFQNADTASQLTSKKSGQTWHLPALLTRFCGASSLLRHWSRDQTPYRRAKRSQSNGRAVTNDAYWSSSSQKPSGCSTSWAKPRARPKPAYRRSALMLARPHPCLGWLHISPADTRRVFDRLLSDRDAALEADPTFSRMPQCFIDWTWQTWLPGNLHRYEKQVREHLK